MEMLTENEQKANRDQLADHLEKNVTDDKYHHHSFVNTQTGAMCAHSHAAAIGMCGMELRENVPVHPQFDDLAIDLISNAEYTARRVFGRFIIWRVFDNQMLTCRAEVIQALREYREADAIAYKEIP